ncbi:MAG: PAS domain S-box protein [Gemmatimonadaceae bacterium]
MTAARVPASTVDQPIQILLVEDNLADARLTITLLSEAEKDRFRITHAPRLSRAIEFLKAEQFSAILLDLGLPDSQGLETLSSARAEAPGAPIIILTGLHDESMAIAAVRDGAQDYIVKGSVTGGLLRQSLSYAIERSRVESTLRESEERFRQLTENISEVFFVMEAHFRETLYISPAYETIWGRSRQSLYDDSTSFLEAIDPEDLPAVRRYIERTQQGIDSGLFEFRVVRADGERRWLHAHAVPVRNDAGEVYRIAGTARDITARKRAEQALRASEERATTLFEAVSLIVLQLDSNGIVEYVNPYFLRDVVRRVLEAGLRDAGGRAKMGSHPSCLAYGARRSSADWRNHRRVARDRPGTARDRGPGGATGLR